MDLTQIILCMLSAFFLGAAICFFVIWLIFLGIPYFKAKRWNKFEEDVVYVVKKNFEKAIYKDNSHEPEIEDIGRTE